MSAPKSGIPLPRPTVLSRPHWDGCREGVLRVQKCADCGSCVFPLGTGDCCLDNETAGCDDQDIQDCVCALDPFCCTTSWDDICAGNVEGQMCGDCPDVGTGSSGSDSGSGSESGGMTGTTTM